MDDFIIRLNELYQISIDFHEIYIADENTKNFPKKHKVHTSTRVFQGKEYKDLYIIEPMTSYLVPLSKKYQNNLWDITENYIGEVGILLQICNNNLLLYNTNQNLIFLNKNIKICMIRGIKNDNISKE